MSDLDSSVYSSVILSTEPKPVGAFPGQLIIEQDTARVYEFTGSQWVSRQGASGASSDFLFEVARGNIPDVSALTISSHNPDVDIGAEEDIWEEGGLLVWPTSAGTVNVASSDGADTSAGTGLRTLLLQGLDGSYNEISEIITMNGITAVPSVNTYLRIRQMIGLSAGSSEVNAGIIRASIVGPGIQCVMGIGESLSKNSQYTAPLGKSFMIPSVDIDLTKSTMGLNPIVEVLGKVRNFGGPWVTGFSLKLDTAVSNGRTILSLAPLVFPAKSDIRMSMITDQNDTDSHARTQLLIMDD